MCSFMQEILNLKFRNNVSFTSESFLCSLDCSCFVLLWINGLKSMGIIGDKIFNKEIQVKMLPHVTVFQVFRAYYCLFVCGDTHRNRS